MRVHHCGSSRTGSQDGGMQEGFLGRLRAIQMRAMQINQRQLVCLDGTEAQSSWCHQNGIADPDRNVARASMREPAREDRAGRGNNSVTLAVPSAHEKFGSAAVRAACSAEACRSMSASPRLPDFSKRATGVPSDA